MRPFRGGPVFECHGNGTVGFLNNVVESFVLLYSTIVSQSRIPWLVWIDSR